ncbi:peptidylprolyl isomerase [Aliikangiella maris]|uniref:peptidylprolyl isomerase n=2 Tax=Aliikangiella maris TaxID=3162458 RepID=A0ABV2BR63_9GAMM
MGACSPVSPDEGAGKNITQQLPEITVNGRLITEKELANELQYHQNNNFNIVVRQAAQALVVRELLLQEAGLTNTELSPVNEEELVQKLLEENVKYDDPDELICMRYFENNSHKFKTAPLLEVKHILLPAAKEDLETRSIAKKQAKELIKKLQKNPEDFSALAHEFSACPSKKDGGMLGQISKGQTVPEFERQISGMSEGLVLKPIESRYGFHIVDILRKVEGKQLEYAMVADKVRGYLVHRASHLAVQEYIQSLVAKAEIEGIEMQFVEENIFLG